ncbi:MAG TPA: serine protease [Planktothrix sp.]
MSSTGYSEFEQLLYNDLAYGNYSDNASLLQAAQTEFSQVGGSSSDLSAVANAASNVLASEGDGSTTSGSTAGSDTGSSATGSTSAGSDAGSSTGSTSTGSDTGSTSTGSTTAGSDTGNTTATTGSASSAVSNAEAATVQVTANDGGGEESLGSGYFVNSSGLIATDDHVVQGANSVQITSADGQTYNANVVYTDASNDVAFLQVQGAGNTSFSSLSLGDSSDITSTDSAIGHPNGDSNIVVNSGNYEGTTTFGALDVTDNSVADNPNRTMDEFGNMGVQEGSSGSAIVNSNGVVVSMVDIGDGEGDEDATPASTIASDLAQYESSAA